MRGKAADSHYYPTGTGLDDIFNHYCDQVIAAFDCDDCTAVTAFDYNLEQFNPNCYAGSNGTTPAFGHYDQQLDSDGHRDVSTLHSDAANDRRHHQLNTGIEHNHHRNYSAFYSDHCSGSAGFDSHNNSYYYCLSKPNIDSRFMR